MMYKDEGWCEKLLFQQVKYNLMLKCFAEREINSE